MKPFLAGLCLAWLPFARVVLNPALTLLYRDLTNVHLPAKALWLRGVMELGRLPHWNPYLASGMPFLSDPVLGALHPANLLFLLAPSHPERGLIYFLLAHYLALYLGGYLLARTERVRPWLSAAAGLSLAWGGSAISYSSNLPDLAGLTAVPFFFFFLKKRQALGAAFALAFPVLTGNAQFTYLLVLISLALHGRHCFKFLLRVFAAGALISAPQLLPTLAHFSETARASLHIASAEQLTWSLHPVRLLEIFFPQPFGSRPDYGSYLGFPFTSVGARTDPFVFSFYPSLFTVAFGMIYAIAVFSRRRRWRIRSRASSLGYLALLFLALGSHTPLATLAARWIPLWGAFRYPERLTFWLAFFAWLAATRGAERVLRLTAAGAKVGWVAYAIYLPCAAAVAWWSSQAGFPAALISLAAFSALAIILDCGSRGRLPARWLAPACAALLAAEAGLVAERLVWVMPASIAEPGFSLLQRKLLADRANSGEKFARGGAFRLYSFSYGTFDENDPREQSERERYGSMEREMRKAWEFLRFYTGGMLGFELAHRQGALAPLRAIYELETKSTPLLNRFLDLASVRYLVIDPERSAVIRPSALPYAYFPPFTEGAPAQALVARLAEETRNPAEAVLLEGIAPRKANPGCWFVQDVKRFWDHVGLQLTSTARCGSATLLVNEAFDNGWRAEFGNGGKAEILRANSWAQAITVPASARAGEALSLSLDYRERTFFPGCLLFLLGIAAALLL